MIRIGIVCLLTMATHVLWAQLSKPVPLEDMSAFKAQAGNWFIVGDVTIDPNIDIHHQEAPVPEETGKRKKSKKAEPVIESPKAVTYTAGTGILLNMNTEIIKDNLIINFEHGDIELELEVMMPKGSNSGIFLQGRYEVQLLDSWGVREASFSDIGGIYRNWEADPEKIYMGKAPITNAAKAPGLWQKMKISFRAPRFDASGKKIANAKFTSVELNGVIIHENIEVPKLTGAPIENNEKPLGPLMIQGDHGPVAFRNISYRLLHDSEVSLSDISYKTFRGNFKSEKEFVSTKPFSTGTIPELTWEIAATEDAFGIIYKGTINIPEDDDYSFALNYNGDASLSVNVNIIIQGGKRNTERPIQLKKGSYPFELIYFKDVNWLPPQIAFYVTSSNTHTKSLQAFNSFPPDADMVSTIRVDVKDKPRLLRAFLDFKDDRSKRLTHTIGVGEPGGINYIYDLKAGNVACVWHGDFVDATPMWHDRGDGSFRPLGMTQYFFSGPSLALLADQQDAFLSLSDEKDFKGKGYIIDEATGRPVFKYTYKGIDVEDKIYPDADDKLFIRAITFKNVSGSGFYYKIAEGNEITLLPNGSYVMGDKEYYVKVLSQGTPIIRDQPHGKKELIVQVDGKEIKYSIVW